MALDSLLQEELDWRTTELGLFKMLAAGDSGLRRDAMTRSLVLFTYAHYEGFCKVAFASYLLEIQSTGIQVKDLIRPLQVWSLKKDLAELRSHSHINLLDFCEQKFPTTFNSVCTLPQEVDTYSNLWPKLLKEICLSLGVNHHIVSKYWTDLKDLVDLRNQIAHGKKLPLDLKKAFVLENSTVNVMYEISYELIDSLTSAKFKI